MMKRDSVSLFLCVPLMFLLFWQGASCKSTKANKTSTANENHSMNTNSSLPQGSNVKGTWGGQGISMEVTDGGAEINYDCAHGSIADKIVLDSQGHVSARGRHARILPGPTREGA